jgi:hypothetical protein
VATVRTQRAELSDAPTAIVLRDGPGTAIVRLFFHVAEPARYDSDNLAKALVGRQERSGLKIHGPAIALRAAAVDKVVASSESEVCDVGGIGKSRQMYQLKFT